MCAMLVDCYIYIYCRYVVWNSVLHVPILVDYLVDVLSCVPCWSIVIYIYIYYFRCFFLELSFTVSHLGRYVCVDR